MQKLNAVPTGISFLKKFRQFFKIIVASIGEAIKTGGNLIDIYRQKQMDQKIKNIEKMFHTYHKTDASVTLTDELLVEELTSFAQAYFQSRINATNKNALKEALEAHAANPQQLSEQHKMILASLNIPPQKQQEFEHYLSDKYGEQYTAEFKELIHQQFSLTDTGDLAFHAIKMKEITCLSQMVQPLSQESQAIMNEPQQEQEPCHPLNLESGARLI